MARFHFRRITDAVYGTFGISKLESDIISTKAFQRLHNVKQLGLAYLVYPDANYSRFAHSVGACHVAGRMMQAIQLNSNRQFDEEERQLYRLAALLHDLGHYPFSHAMEHVVQDHYQERALLEQPQQAAREVGDQAAVRDPVAQPVAQPQDQGERPPAAFSHETLGRKIIELDAEIGAVLERHRLSRDDLKAAFSRERPGSLVSLVSSDLDCDRLDYLMRTSRHAGLPYGRVDADYIIGQTCIDSHGMLCLSKKAMRAADHLLVSRYFDYTQIVFHKTVVGMEEVLKDVISQLLARGLVDCSGATLENMIRDGTFADFDDHFLVGRIRQAATELATGDPLALKIASVLSRKPPKLVVASERIDSREGRRDHKNRFDQLRQQIPRLAARFEIDETLWHPWEVQLDMTKIGSHIPLTRAEEGEFEEEAAQAVRILTTDSHAANCRSLPLVEHNSALMKQLSNSRLYAIRLYVHIGGDAAAARERRDQIAARIRQDLPNFPFEP
jgi:HD superfamily phosphohydrolase